jgi:hypothetical protein
MIACGRKYSNNIAIGAIFGVVLSIIFYCYYTIDVTDGISSQQKLTIRYESNNSNVLLALMSNSCKNLINKSFLIFLRVNTFRRLDLLETFLRYYKECKIVQEVQVVWSDQDNRAPFHWINDFGLPTDKYKFEIHRNNSLSNRFRPLLSIPTSVNYIKCI